MTRAAATAIQPAVPAEAGDAERAGPSRRGLAAADSTGEPAPYIPAGPPEARPKTVKE